MWESFVLAIIAPVGAIIVALLVKYDKRNTVQHANNMKVLNKIDNKIDKLDDRVYAHVVSHNE